ncbi:hypothetical protein [Amycolatopsis sacchari]|uniref:hypothetical protein n=1 Tax=Amycolatopsis sacchari TaxID=115433 RepID=UPI0015A66909|nr:hypothetical protein [Amycolatopsis sacchari]
MAGPGGAARGLVARPQHHRHEQQDNRDEHDRQVGFCATTVGSLPVTVTASVLPIRDSR